MIEFFQSGTNDTIFVNTGTDLINAREAGAVINAFSRHVIQNYWRPVSCPLTVSELFPNFLSLLSWDRPKQTKGINKIHCSFFSNKDIVYDNSHWTELCSV